MDYIFHYTVWCYIVQISFRSCKLHLGSSVNKIQQILRLPACRILHICLEICIQRRPLQDTICIFSTKLSNFHKNLTSKIIWRFFYVWQVSFKYKSIARCYRFLFWNFIGIYFWIFEYWMYWERIYILEMNWGLFSKRDKPLLNRNLH